MILIIGVVVAVVILLAFLYTLYVKQEVESEANNYKNTNNVIISDVAIDSNLVAVALEKQSKLTELLAAINTLEATAASIKEQVQTDASLELQYQAVIKDLSYAHDSYTATKVSLDEDLVKMNTETRKAYDASVPAVVNPNQPQPEVITKELIVDATVKGVRYYQLDNTFWLEANAANAAGPVELTPEEQKAAEDKLIAKKQELIVAFMAFKTAMDKLKSDPAVQQLVVVDIIQQTGVEKVSMDYHSSIEGDSIILV